MAAPKQSSLAPIIRDGDSGANRHMKAPSAVAFPPSHFTPVPIGAVLQGAVVGLAYSESISAQGGTGPYTFAVTSGSLPSGLSMTSAGAISGTPSTAISYTFTITVTDALGYRGSQGFVIVVASPAIAASGGSFVFIS